MSTYKIKVAHDVALVSLVDFPVQPMSPGYQYTQRNYGADGTIHDQGPYIPLKWDILTETQYIALLTQCGLATATVKRAAVTVYIKNESFGWARYNGWAQRPLNLNRNGYFLRNVTILITDLALSA
jgi:hypothetical protein